MIALLQSFFSTTCSLVWFYKPFDGRYVHLKYALEGLRKTSVPLVGFDGFALIPFSAADDPGIYWLIPKIALMLNCSLDVAIKLFMYGVPVLSSMSGLIACFYMFRSKWQKAVAIIGLSAILFLSLRIGDTYMIYSSITVALVPWALYLCTNETRIGTYFSYGLYAGLLIGFSQFFRAYSGLSSLLFILTLFIACKTISKYKKLSALTFLAFGMLIAHSFTRYQERSYHEFAKANFSGHTLKEYKHPLWHMIYIGFGFLKFGNIDNIRFEDKSAGDFLEKKRMGNPKLSGASDEEILKIEVLRIIREQNFFVIFTIFGKFGILLMLFLLAANFGAAVSLFFPKPFAVEMSFINGIFCSAIMPIITMPFLTYCLGFIAFSVLYGVISINFFLDSVLLTSGLRRSVLSMRKADGV
ncbi:MAG TPA: hypothetical protein VHO47_05665 [Candidatus Babeliales bacterium]|nr:hypothetical protein [Candidatus Babeliales bacterium]